MIDNGGIMQRVEAFHERQGGNFVKISDGWLLYSNGAMREINPLGMLKEPPRDEQERLRLIAKFWEFRLDLAVEKFDLLKYRHIGQAKIALKSKVAGGLRATDKVVEELKELKSQVLRYRKKYSRAMDALDDSETPRQKQLREQDTRNRITASQLIQDLESIEI